MSTELPKLGDGKTEYPVCSTCSARDWDPQLGKYLCNPDLFTGNHGKIKKRRPLNCPLTRQAPGTTEQAQKILRKMYRP